MTAHGGAGQQEIGATTLHRAATGLCGRNDELGALARVLNGTFLDRPGGGSFLQAASLHGRCLPELRKPTAHPAPEAEVDPLPPPPGGGAIPGPSLGRSCRTPGPAPHSDRGRHLPPARARCGHWWCTRPPVLDEAGAGLPAGRPSLARGGGVETWRWGMLPRGPLRGDSDLLGRPASETSWTTAIKHSPPGGRVEVDMAGRRRGYSITVTDQAPGSRAGPGEPECSSGSSGWNQRPGPQGEHPHQRGGLGLFPRPEDCRHPWRDGGAAGVLPRSEVSSGPELPEGGAPGSGPPSSALPRIPLFMKYS